jgi:DNA gyrase subunit A
LRHYKVQKRGGRGITTAKVTTKTGMVTFAHVSSEDNTEIIAVSRKGNVIRISIESVSTLGRSTQGVRIMKLQAGDGVASVVVV